MKILRNAAVVLFLAGLGLFLLAQQPVLPTGSSGSGSHQVAVDSSGNLMVNIGAGLSNPLPVSGTFWPYSLGQQVAASSVPVILPSATITTLTPPTNPCLSAVPTSYPFSLTASGVVVSGTSGKKTYVCGLNLISATAQNIALVEATSTCGGTVTGMAGGTTAATGWNLAANGGLAQGNGAGVIAAATNATGDNVCLLLSGSGQTSGNVMAVQQ